MILKNNVVGSFNVLEAARKNKITKIIFASSNAAVGECNSSINENIRPNPTNLYGVSKLSVESYMYSYKKIYNINTISLRFGNVYGPGSINKTSIVPKFIKNLIQEKNCLINGDGKQTRDFIYIEDLIEAIYLCSKKSKLSGRIVSNCF